MRNRISIWNSLIHAENTEKSVYFLHFMHFLYFLHFPHFLHYLLFPHFLLFLIICIFCIFRIICVFCFFCIIHVFILSALSMFSVFFYIILIFCIFRRVFCIIRISRGVLCPKIKNAIGKSQDLLSQGILTSNQNVAPNNSLSASWSPFDSICNNPADMHLEFFF